MSAFNFARAAGAYETEAYMKIGTCFFFLLMSVVFFFSSAASAAGPKLYVVYSGGDGVAVVDPDALDAWGVVKTGSGANMLQPSKDGKYVFVTISDEDKVQVIDTATDKVEKSIKVGGRPFALALAGAGSPLVVANMNEGSITVIDALSLEPTGAVKTYRNALEVRVSPDGRKAYVAHQGPELVAVDLQNMKKAAEADVPEDINSMELSRSGDTIYLYSEAAGEIIVKETVGLRTTETIKAYPMMGLKLSPDENYLWFNGPPEKISVYSIKEKKVVAQLPRDSSVTYCEFAFSPDGKTAFAGPAGVDNDMVYAYDAVKRELKGKIKLPRTPRGLAYVEK